MRPVNENQIDKKLKLDGSLLEQSPALLTAGVYALMLAYAVSVTMIGPLMPELIREYGISLSQGGLILSAQSIGGILAIIGGGLVADRLHKGYLLAGAFAVFIFSLFLIATAPAYSLLLAMFFVLGASTRFVDTVNNALTADLHPHTRDVALNLLHTCFGVGALFGPLFARVILNRGTDWSRVYGLLGVGCMAILAFFVVAVYRFPLQKKELTVGETASSLRALLLSWKMWIGCLIMMMYVGHQSGLVVWLPMYLQDYLGASPLLGSLSLSTLWIGIILGRFFCARITRFVPAEKIIIYGSLAGGLILLLGFIVENPLLIIACTGIAGLITGAIIPLLVNIVCNWYPLNSGTVSAMIFLSGSLATMIFPWLIGWTAEIASFYWAITITGLTLLIVSGLGFFLMQAETSG